MFKSLEILAIAFDVIPLTPEQKEHTVEEIANNEDVRTLWYDILDDVGVEGNVGCRLQKYTRMAESMMRPKDVRQMYSARIMRRVREYNSLTESKKKGSVGQRLQDQILRHEARLAVFNAEHPDP